MSRSSARPSMHRTQQSENGVGATERLDRGCSTPAYAGRSPFSWAELWADSGGHNDVWDADLRPWAPSAGDGALEGAASRRRRSWTTSCSSACDLCVASRRSSPRCWPTGAGRRGMSGASRCCSSSVVHSCTSSILRPARTTRASRTRPTSRWLQRPGRPSSCQRRCCSSVFRTAEGTKLAGAVQGDEVAFEADGYERHTGEAWSGVVKGHAEEIRARPRSLRHGRPAAVPVARRAEAAVRPDRARRGQWTSVPCGATARRGEHTGWTRPRRQPSDRAGDLSGESDLKRPVARRLVAASCALRHEAAAATQRCPTPTPNLLVPWTSRRAADLAIHGRRRRGMTHR
jgi:hypothetical protein